MEKARNWSGVCYPENMIDSWKEDIEKILQLPFAYCVHDKDVETDGTPRKTHVHIVVIYGNTTTQASALKLLNKLSKPGCTCCPVVESVVNIKYIYDYLCHDTDDCKKKHKHEYDKAERVTGNAFDIGSYEQIGIKEKNDMARELCDIIIRENYTNFSDFYCYAISNLDNKYFEILKTYSGLFERLTKGNFQKSLANK